MSDATFSRFRSSSRGIRRMLQGLMIPLFFAVDSPVPRRLLSIGNRCPNVSCSQANGSESPRSPFLGIAPLHFHTTIASAAARTYTRQTGSCNRPKMPQRCTTQGCIQWCAICMAMHCTADLAEGHFCRYVRGWSLWKTDVLTYSTYVVQNSVPSGCGPDRKGTDD